jgi:hypothetical protein
MESTCPGGGGGNIKWIISIKKHSGNLRVFNPEIEDAGKWDSYCSFLKP